MPSPSLLYVIRQNWEEYSELNPSRKKASTCQLLSQSYLDAMYDCCKTIREDDANTSTDIRHRCYHERLGMQPSMVQTCHLLLPMCFNSRDASDLQLEKWRAITAKEFLVARVDREAAKLKLSCAQ